MAFRKWLGALVLALIGLLTACGGTATPQAFGVGSPAPGFTLPDAAGGEVSLADYKGKQPVLLFFHMAVG
ncbi:MAG: redoxin domain-containing protein [Anaerolineae bacterium]|nr:redoxin domain-containing protein [Anaerolineae bacterium]